MKTLLVLASHPELAEAVRAALPPEQYRVIHRLNLEEAEPLLGSGMLDASLVDMEFTQVQGLWLIEKLRRRVPQCPVVVFVGARPWEWEEEAYVQGVAHVLTKPLRGRMLHALLERLWVQPSAAARTL